MIRSHSPLRYPGGKTSIFDLVSAFIEVNNLQRRHYAEPYAGGCGLALVLLYNGFVCDIHINDIDRGIWAFWNAVLNHTDELEKKIIDTPVNMDEWNNQKKIISSPDDHDDFALGFATFFLNRTNRSGIIRKAGVIGGKSQNGNYKLDCRYNKLDLIKRIRRIEKYKKRIHLTNQDALEFIQNAKKQLPKDVFFFIDPPYYNKGSSLYTNFYKPNDHAKIADILLNLDRHWILTYDNDIEIKKLYKLRRQYEFNLNYSLNTKRVGTELMITSKRLYIPEQFKANLSHHP